MVDVNPLSPYQYVAQANGPSDDVEHITLNTYDDLLALVQTRSRQSKKSLVLVRVRVDSSHDNQTNTRYDLWPDGTMVYMSAAPGSGGGSGLGGVLTAATLQAATDMGLANGTVVYVQESDSLYFKSASGLRGMLSFQ